MSHTDEINLQRQLKQLMKETKPPLINALSRMLPRYDIDDVLQETYLIWYQKQQEGPIQHSKAFVFRVARNLAISRLRNTKVQVAYQQDCALHDMYIDISMSSTLAKNQNQQLLTNAISSLPSLCKQVFILRKLHGKSHQEISHIFGISIKTIENHITKGMHHCRQHITEHSTTKQKANNEL
jgi:RNA polymerase sigma-70 factor (ECF subfamily)